MNTSTNVENTLAATVTNAIVDMMVPVPLARQIPGALWINVMSAIDADQENILKTEANSFAFVLQGESYIVQYMSELNKLWTNMPMSVGEVFGVSEHQSLDIEGLRLLMVALGQSAAALRVSLFQNRPSDSHYDRAMSAVSAEKKVSYHRPTGNYAPFIEQTPEQQKRDRNRKIVKYGAAGLGIAALIGLGITAAVKYSGNSID